MRLLLPLGTSDACIVDQCQRNEHQLEYGSIGDAQVKPGGRVDTNLDGSWRKHLK